MPLPLLAGAGLAGKLFSGLNKNAALAAVGLGGQRGRTPAQNRRMRQSQVRDAEAMARAGDQFGLDLIWAWQGNPSKQGVKRASYRSGVPQGTMPADGRKLAEEAIQSLDGDNLLSADLLKLSSGAKRASTTKGTKATAASQGAAARKGTVTRGGPRERTYVRYDPDSGERVTGITQDDPRYSEWPNRKPRAVSTARRATSTRAPASRRKTKTQRETDAAIRRITTEATRAGLRLTASGARAFASMAAAAGLSAGAAAALVVGTGVAAYAATRWLIGRIETVTDPAYKREQVALAYRRARLDWEKREGRKLTKLEHDFLARNFKDALKALDAGVTYNP